MLSVGGIPNRTAVCKTLSPLGGGKDDSANIQNAIESCSAGQVVMLSSGAFTIAEGNLVFIDKGVTLRGGTWSHDIDPYRGRQIRLLHTRRQSVGDGRPWPEAKQQHPNRDEIDG